MVLAHERRDLLEPYRRLNHEHVARVLRAVTYTVLGGLAFGNESQARIFVNVKTLVGSNQLETEFSCHLKSFIAEICSLCLAQVVCGPGRRRKK